MTWNHPALAQRALDEGDAEIKKLRAEIERLRAALKELVDAPFDIKQLAGGAEYLRAWQNARAMLNEQLDTTKEG